MSAARIAKLVAALAVSATVVVAGFRIGFMRALLMERSALVDYLSSLPDRGAPSYPRFLDAVRQHTSNGDSVAIVVPMRHWNDGYAYAYYRASYLLAGRRVVPIVGPDDRTMIDRLASVDYIAAWHKEVAIPNWITVMRTADGALLKRPR